MPPVFASKVFIMTEVSDNHLTRLHRLRQEAEQGGGPARIEAQHNKGKLTARERLVLLLDNGSFVELDQLVVHDCQDFGLASIRGDGVVTGFGKIDGRTVYVFSQDATVFGGSLSAMVAKKICKVMDLAIRNASPIIGINDSGGARIHEGVASLGGYADIFYRNVAASGVVPQLSLIMGPCAGGAVYSPAITDAIFMVDTTSHMFITGPDVIAEVTGEQIDFPALGGSVVHSSKSGVCDRRCQSENEAMIAGRRWLSYLPSSNRQSPPRLTDQFDDRKLEQDRQQLATIVPNESNRPYDMNEVVARIVDQNSLFIMQADFAPNIITALARLNGQSIAVVANNPLHIAGVLDSDASVKAARFVRFCDAFNLPILTLVDVPGFLPGVDQEHQGIIRHGAKLLYAYCEATVAKITVIIRKAYGGAYDVMSSKHIGGDFNFAWPGAEIAVMGSEGACKIIFKKDIAQASDPAQKRAELIADYRAKFANPYIAAEKGYLDAVILPQETRETLIVSLEATRDKQLQPIAKKHGNIPL